jgi:hypothetical protein
MFGEAIEINVSVLETRQGANGQVTCFPIITGGYKTSKLATVGGATAVPRRAVRCVS